MANFRHAFAGQVELLSWLAPYQNTGLYPKARVINSSGTLVDTINLSANGTIAYLYTGSHTPPAEGSFTIVYDIYTDSGRTTLDESISGASEIMLVKDISGSRGAKLGAGRESISREQMRIIAEEAAKQVWEHKLGKETAAKVLKSKSEFNPKSEKVLAETSFPIEEIRGMVEKAISEKMEYHKEEMREAVQTGMKGTERLFKSDLSETRNAISQQISSLDSSQTYEDLRARIDDGFSQITSDLADKIDKEFSGLDMNKMMATMKECRDACISILQEVAVAEKMMDAMDARQRNRLDQVIETIKMLVMRLPKVIHDANLSTVFSGLDIVNSKLKQLPE